MSLPTDKRYTKEQDHGTAQENLSGDECFEKEFSVYLQMNGFEFHEQLTKPWSPEYSSLRNFIEYKLNRLLLEAHDWEKNYSVEMVSFLKSRCKTTPVARVQLKSILPKEIIINKIQTLKAAGDIFTVVTEEDTLPTQDTNVQWTIQVCDETSLGDIDRYINRIDSKQLVKRRNLRVMFVGQEGSGKTCLLKNLLAKSLDETESTDGRSIYIQQYVIDMKTFKRFEQKDESETSTRKQKELLTTTTEMNEELFVDLKNNDEDEQRRPVQCIDDIQKVPDKTDTDIRSVQKKCIATFWDFGGQEDYYNTHDLFLSSDAVYLVVFNLANFCSPIKILSDKEIDKLTYWLQLVVSYSTDQDINTDTVARKQTPPIVLIGTHLDKMEDKVTDKQMFVNEIKRRLMEDQTSKAILQTHITGIFTVSNTRQNEEAFNEVWEAVLSSANLQSQWEKPLPALWPERERDLMSKKQDVKVLSSQEIKEIFQDMTNAENGNEDIFLFLRYLHLTGNIMMCESGHPWSIIIDLQWLADAFEESIITPKNMNKEVWKTYWDSGKLPLQLIRLAWQRTPNAKYLQNERILLAAMRQFGLIVNQTAKNQEQEQIAGQEDHEDIEFVVPCKLPEIGPEPFRSLLLKRNVIQSSTLCFYFKSNFIQYSMFDKFIAYCMQNYRSFNGDDDGSFKLMQRRFVCLETPNDPWKMILCCKLNVVKVTLFNLSGAAIQSGVGYYLRNQLGNILKQTLKITHQTHLEFSEKLHCNFITMNNENFVDPDILLSTEGKCHCEKESHKNLTKSDYNFWFVLSNNKQFEEHDTKEMPLVTQFDMDIDKPSQLVEAADNVQQDVSQSDDLTHSSLCCGTRIVSPITNCVGTAGAFVEHISGRTAFITAVHVVVPSSLWETHPEERWRYLKYCNIPVCKNTQMREQIGNVVKWCYLTDTVNQTSVTAALVEVYQPYKITFPEIIDDQWENAGYNSDKLSQLSLGKALTMKKIRDKHLWDSTVLKYGSTSRITLGHFVYDGSCIKILNAAVSFSNKDAPVQMYGLIGVQGAFSTDFSMPGDSGSLCCIVDKTDSRILYPFGMAVAHSKNTGITYVTPLEDIFRELDLDMNQIKFCPFNDPPQSHQYLQSQSNSQANTEVALSHNSTNIEKTVNEIQSRLDNLKKKTDKRLGNIESRLCHVLEENKKIENKIDLLIAHMMPRTPAEYDIKQQSSEEIEQEELLR